MLHQQHHLCSHHSICSLRAPLAVNHQCQSALQCQLQLSRLTHSSTSYHHLQFHNLPGKTQCKISNHVWQAIKNKIWSYSYVDLGALLDSNTNPEDEEEYDLFPDRTNNCISFKPSNKHASITSFSAWNQAFHVLIEITCAHGAVFPHYI